MTEIISRDVRTGRFLPGNSGFGGRPKGSRNKLGEAFISDLRDVWNEMGVEALRRCAIEEPAQFVRVVASLMPRDIHLGVDAAVNPNCFLETFRTAVQALGNEPPARPRMKVIDHGQR